MDHVSNPKILSKFMRMTKKKGSKKLPPTCKTSCDTRRANELSIAKFIQRRLKPMSPRWCECRVCGHGHITSKPSIYRAPSYGLRNRSGSLKTNFGGGKTSVCKMKRVDCSSHRMKTHFVWDFQRSPEGSLSSRHGRSKQ